MIILVAGQYEPDYNRSKIIFDGLAGLPGVQVLFYHYPSKKYFNKKDFLRLEQQADIIFIPSFGHKDMIFLKKFSSKPFVFDPLISRYLTQVFDYKNIGRYSFGALKNFWRDKKSMTLADIVLCDTHAHGKYFTQHFNVPEHKIKHLPIGVHTTDFSPVPAQPSHSKFIVGFYGSFNPLQGTSAIVEAANLLKTQTDIEFQLLGTGSDFEATRSIALEKYGLKNIIFQGWVPYQQLNEWVNKFDICLGIFGETEKASLVIPNKIYHYAGTKKAIISMKSEAILELFTDRSDILLAATPSELAAAIQLLKEDIHLRNRLAENAYTLVAEKYNQTAIAKKLVAICEAVLKEKAT
jgi:glycosyltransferase involved in cell wall biosynthesis